MNADRRKQLQQAIDLMTAALEGEQTAFDNLPESFQSGDQGDGMQENIDQIQEAIDQIQYVLER